MSNEDFIIRTHDLNTVSNSAANSDYNAKSTVNGLNPVVSEGVNFRVRAGFENTSSASPFSVFLSGDSIDFGTLSPTNPIIRTVDLGVDSLSTFGYSVIVYEDHPLQMNSEASEATIPDTTCDNGECNQEKANVWINTLTYGFGYRCDSLIGADCDSSFSKPNYYKSFANSSNMQSPQSIISGIGSGNRDIRLSYKVIISGNQAKGIYYNTVTYIAVPNF